MADADTAIRPYRVDIPQAALDDLAGRLSRAQWPDELPGATGSYGMTTARVRDLAGYWRDEFDWRGGGGPADSPPPLPTGPPRGGNHLPPTPPPPPAGPARSWSTWT